MGTNNINAEDILSNQAAPDGALPPSGQHRISSGEIFYDGHFLEQLRLEKLRAQRSNLTLSIILLTPAENNGEKVRMSEVLEFVRANTRDTDTIGLVNHKTIGVLLPHTDENGAQGICEKILTGDHHPQFTATISSYPNHIFESLAKTGAVKANAYPFRLKPARGSLWWYNLLKRAIDIIGALTGIIMLSPLMLAAALAVKASSPGPAIFRQTRLGRQGRPFTFYKFRSMHINRDDQIHRDYVRDFINGHQHTNQGDAGEPLYKIKSDPRITRVGSFLRKTSIDELPQFFNVLKGEMSLVGPRPPLAYEAEKYQSWHLMRILEMKPGITGLWQVDGRSKTQWDDSVRLDIRYIKSWSPLLDIKILLRTIRAVIRDRGAL